MKLRTFRAILLGTLILALPIWARFDTVTDIYARDMVIVKVDYDTDLVTLKDAYGNTYTWKGCEDWYEGDKVACVMDKMGTAHIDNDRIIKMNYQG